MSGLAGRPLTAELVADMIRGNLGGPVYVSAHPRHEDVVRAGAQLAGGAVDVRIDATFPPDVIHLQSEPYE